MLAMFTVNKKLSPGFSLKGWQGNTLAMLSIVCGGLLISGCIPDDPNKPLPAAKIFTGAYISGASLGPAPGAVLLDPLLINNPRVVKSITGEPGICYTTDGTTPEYIDVDGKPYCTGGSTAQYHGAAWLRCDGSTATGTSKTLTIRYLWKVGAAVSDQIVSANYQVDCVPPPEGAMLFDIVARSSDDPDGYIENQDATVYVKGGKAVLDPNTGSLTYNAVVETTGTTHIITNSNTEIYGVLDMDPDANPATEFATLEWASWGNYRIDPETGLEVVDTVGNDISTPRVTNPRSVLKSCHNLGGVINGCNFVIMHKWSWQKIVYAHGSTGAVYGIDINTAMGAETDIPIHLGVQFGNISLDTFTRFTLKRYQ
jgi:hypothetical protein